MYYVITKGRKSTIVNSWKDCILIIKSNNGANYEEFNNKEDAKEFYEAYNKIKNGGITYDFKEIKREEKNVFNKLKYKPLNEERNKRVLFIKYIKGETREEGNRRALKELKLKELEEKKKKAIEEQK